jgi:hypothetical protein
MPPIEEEQLLLLWALWLGSLVCYKNLPRRHDA